jgi:regulator of sirC expression with transglutaminase-like and TPR domain
MSASADLPAVSPGPAWPDSMPARDYLTLVGMTAGDRIDLASAALALAVLDRPQARLAEARAHLAGLGRSVAIAFEAAGREDLDACCFALAAVLARQEGYDGDRDHYDDLANANLISVIERRRGLPVSLGVLYLHAARLQGWNAVGLDFPGHFLIRLEHRGERAILDPFNGGALLEVADLRRLLKASHGPAAELETRYCDALPDRAVLLRLENNIKRRLIAARALGMAGEHVRRMLLLAPDETGLWRELGLIEAESGNLRAAAAALERFAAAAPEGGERQQARRLIQELKSRLN